MSFTVVTLAGFTGLITNTFSKLLDVADYMRLCYCPSGMLSTISDHGNMQTKPRDLRTMYSKTSLIRAAWDQGVSVTKKMLLTKKYVYCV